MTLPREAAQNPVRILCNCELEARGANIFVKNTKDIHNTDVAWEVKGNKPKIYLDAISLQQAPLFFFLTTSDVSLDNAVVRLMM